MPTFTREEIEHLGDLARIALTDEEITRLQGELNVIADSINKVQEVAGDDVPPTANPVPLEAYLRPDVAETPLTQEVILAVCANEKSGIFGEQNWWFNARSYGLCWSLVRSFVHTYLKQDGTPFTAAADYAVKSFAEEMEGRDLRLEQTVRGRNFLWDGKTAVADIKNLSLTGYQVIKYTLDESKYDGGAKNINSIPLIRYAEVLLNYAEAKAELGEFSDDIWNKTIKPLRERAGVDGKRPTSADPYLQQYYGLSDSDLLEIRRERAIELLLEGFRYDDLMRWHAGELLNKQWYGIYIPAMDTSYDLNGDGINDVCVISGEAGNEPGVTYIVLDDSKYSLENGTTGRLLYTVGRNFEEKRYLRPIPKTALNINPDLGQNYYWR